MASLACEDSGSCLLARRLLLTRENDGARFGCILGGRQIKNGTQGAILREEGRPALLFAASCVLCRVQLDLWVSRFPWYTVGWRLGAIVAEGPGLGWERHTSQPQGNLSSGVEPRQEAVPTAAHHVTQEGGGKLRV